MIPTEILNLGAVSILFFLFLEKFFSYLKTKKNGNINKKAAVDYERDLSEIRLQLGNHYNALREDVTKMQTDIAIIKNNINDIKIALKK